MSTSREQGPRLRRLNYEPTTAQGTACPHCGTTIDTTSVVARTGGTSPDVPVVTVPDAEEVRPVVAGVVRVLIEALDGRRGAAQLERAASPRVCRYLHATRLARGPAHATRVRSLRLCRPRVDVVEVAMVVLLAGHVRAVAARMESASEVGGWRCTAFRIL
ncbi:MAG: hypothetical protein J0I49_14770 [Pseudonocardia sp.]|jgi:hypothetical protein|uniref:Rv3235 family protein n=1 Tax=Pseudonocardia sp. TaxID=60912 RepID=UPI001ACF9457|nr:Rv3235 family protein [Pseudonocardia sp.]MBN9099357.1 hypothetical protein [Pseudonocardia sp.]